MRVAVCLYGYPRFYQYGYNFFKNFLDGVDFDFFIHAWCDKETSENDRMSLKSEIYDIFKPKKLEIENQKDFNQEWNFEIDFSKLKREVIEKGNGLQVTLSPMYSIYRCGQLLKESNIKYDLVIFTRTDVFCTKKLKDFGNFDTDFIYSSSCIGDVWNLTDCGDAIDTKMIMGSHDKMCFFSDIFNHTQTYIEHERVSLCHHRLFAHHLRKINSNFEMIFREHATWFYYRKDGVLEGEIISSNIENHTNYFTK